MRYDDFDVWIDSQEGDRAPIRAKSKSMDEAEGKLTVDDFNRLKQDAANLKSGFDEASIKQFGTALFKALLPDAVGALYRRALKQTDDNPDTGLRLRVRIASSDVADLPWELIYDETRDCFLSTASDIVLTRFVEVDKPIRELQITPPIRILVVVAGRGDAAIEERMTLEKALSGIDEGVEIQFLDKDATLDNVESELVRNTFHILHFVSDGIFSSEQPCLQLDDANSTDLCAVTAEQLSYFFQSHPSLKVALFHSSSSTGKNSVSLRCVAENLVRLGAPAAVSLRGPNKGQSATVFARNFYRKLCVGSDRGRVDLAASHARLRVKAELSRTCDFASPILFMRTPTGVVFEIPSPAINTISDLHTTKAIASTQDYNIEQHEKAGNQEAAAREKKARSEVQTVIKQFYKRLALSATTWIIGLALVLSVLVLFASYTRILNAFRVDDYLGGLQRLVSDKSTHELNSSVKILMAREKELGPSETRANFRANHARLVREFAAIEKKPAVIAFDAVFNESAPPDTDFAKAIRAAQGAGIAVVGSKDVNNDGVIIDKSDLSSDLRPAFGDCWGDVEVGGILNLPFSKNGAFVNMYEIGHLQPGTTNLENEVEIEPSIALKAVMEWLGGAKTNAKAYFNDANQNVIVRAVKGSEAVEKVIPVTRNDISLEMLMDYAPQQSVNNNSREYTTVYNWATSTNPTEKKQLETYFENRIVLVGYDTTEDRRLVLGDGTRSGVEIHANAISNILNGVYIREISTKINFLVIVIMAGVGILMQTVFKKRFPLGVQLKDLPGGKYLGEFIGKFEVPIVLVVAMAIYLLVAYLVYSRSRLSFDMSYHLGSLLFSYFLIGILHKKFSSAW